MSIQSSLDRGIEAFARALLPFANALSSADDTKGWMAELGYDLPSVPPALTALATTADPVLDALTSLAQARDSDDDAAAADAMLALATGVAALATDLHNLGDALRTQLSPDVVAKTRIADDIEQRLIEDLLVRALGDGAPLLQHVLVVFGVLEETQVAADPTRLQPDYVRRTVHFDRLSQLFQDPLALARDVYGWGTPKLEAERLFDALLNLSYHFFQPALIQYPSREFLQAAVPTAPVPDDGPQPMLVFPLCVDFALVPAPTSSPTEAQGLALTILPGGSLHDPVAFGPRLSLAFDATLEVATGLAAIFAPDRPMRVIADPESGTGTAVDGKLVTRVAYARNEDDDGALTVLTLGAGTRLLADQVYVAGGIASDGPTMDLFIEGGIVAGQLVISASDADSFLASVLPDDGLAVRLEGALTWSRNHGLHFTGGAGLETTLGAAVTLGPLYLDGVRIAMTAGASGLVLDVSASGGVTIGPYAASFSGLGLEGGLAFAPGNLGPVDLTVGWKPPSGVGIAIEAGPVTGGGFLYFDATRGRYAGVLTLDVSGITVVAVGVIDTHVPGNAAPYSFVLIVSAEFTPVELGLGFTLNGVGGLAGVHRTVAVDALQAGLKSGALDDLLFPADPIARAATIVQAVETVLPIAAGRYVFAPMALIGWGTPTLIDARIGVLLELPDPVRLIVLGQISARIPPIEPIIEIHLDVLGVIEFSTSRLSIDGSLHDSRVGPFALSGDMAARVSWRGDKSLTLALGGLNPHFQPPAGFPSLRRVTIAIGSGDNPRFDLQAYFAVTSNTLQLGALAELRVGVSGFTVHGWIGFDALCTRSPLALTVDFTAGLDLLVDGSVVAGIHLAGTLTGPSPWHVVGSASISVLFWDISVDVDATFGTPDLEAALVMIDPWPELARVIADAQSWSAVLPAGFAPAVLLAAPDAGGTHLVDAGTGIALRQSVLPLNRTLTRFGAAALTTHDHFDLRRLDLGGRPSLPRADVVSDFFARAQFEELSDADKLSIPSYEKMDAGAQVAVAEVTVGAAIGTDLVYQTIVLGGEVDADTYQLPPDRLRLLEARAVPLRGGALRAREGRFAPPPGTPPQVALAEEQFMIASTLDLSPRADLVPAGSKGAAVVALAQYLVAHPAERGQLRVVALHELDAA